MRLDHNLLGVSRAADREAPGNHSFSSIVLMKNLSIAKYDHYIVSASLKQGLLPIS
jgi:hypothetical protein